MRQLKHSALVALVVVAATALPAAAQERSAIDDLIAGARRALNDLEYARADSIARSLLAMGSRATRQQQIVGLQLVGAALYPEERVAQRPDSARRYLEELVRTTPDAAIPPNISWPGLDSLLTSVRATTFAVWATPKARYELVGANAEARIDVAAARTASFLLTATAIGDSSSIVVDSAGPARQATLRIPALDDDHPVLPWGRYRVKVLGIDSLSGESIELTYLATVEAPPLLLHRVPPAPDPSLFRPERESRRIVRNVLIGVAVGAATVFAATAAGGSDAVGSASGTGRAYAVAAGLSLGGLIGAFLDRGRPLPANVEHNNAVRAAFEAQVRALRDENALRRAEYRATIALVGGNL